MLPNSNRTSVFEHSGWEPKRAEWSRNALRARSRGNIKEPSEAETHSADRFLIKEKRRATAQPDSPPKRERKGKKNLKVSYPASYRSLMLFRYTFS